MFSLKDGLKNSDHHKNWENKQALVRQRPAWITGYFFWLPAFHRGLFYWPSLQCPPFFYGALAVARLITQFYLYKK